MFRIGACCVLLSFSICSGTQYAYSEQLAGNISSQYPIIKQIVVRLLGPAIPEKHRSESCDDHGRNCKWWPPNRGPYNLGTCGDVEIEIGIWPFGTDLTAEVLTRIAIHSVLWKRDLQIRGYPPARLYPIIDSVEQQLFLDFTQGPIKLNKFQDELDRRARALVSDMKRLRTEIGGDASPVYYEAQCGGGGVEIVFKAPTAGGRLFLIRVFFVELCRRQGADPYDRSVCRYWTEIFNGNSGTMAGQYEYVAEWPDGYKKSAKITFDDAGTFQVRR